MDAYREGYRIGYEQGRIIGRVEVFLEDVKYFVNCGVTDNYEEAMRIIEVPEEDCARMMDYLPITYENWTLPSEEEWEEKKKLIKERW